MKKRNFWYSFLRIIATPLFRLYFNPKIINKDVIPKDGAFIICGNHLTFMDQFPVIISTKRVIHWMAKKEYFEGRFGFFFRKTGCIRVDRESHDGKAKKEALSYLKEGDAVGIFPEGTRNKTEEELLEFKTGAVKIAKESKIPIIPFAITGHFKFRSKDLVLRFGESIFLKEEDSIKKSNDLLRKTILNLQRKNYNDK